MSFFNKLLNWRNPTRDWIKVPSIPLVVDLDTNRLSGVGLGDRFDRLSFLGAGRATSFEYIDFPESGIEIICDANELISDLSLFFGHADETREGQFTGAFRYQGNLHSFDSHSSESAIQNLLGKPYWRDQDEDEVILFYERCPEWQIEFGRDGCLKCWTICREPLMADAEQRESYRVTVPWPPTSPWPDASMPRRR